jgi:lipopolysaccharide export system permease protein
MQLYSKYIARQLVHATLLITISLTSIVWLMQALRFIDFIVNQGVSIGLFLKLTLLLMPSLVLTLLPAAFFCAVIFTYSKLKTDSELIVMQSMGLDKWKLTQPALRVAIGLTVLAYFIALYVMPVSMRGFRDLQTFLRNNYVSILLQEGVFSSPVDGLTVFIRERYEDGTLKGILVHDARKRGSAITMMADQAILVQTPSGPRFLMEHGNRQEMENGKLSLLNYDSYTLDISFYTDAGRIKARDPQELFVQDLLKYDEAITPQENSKRRSEIHQRILWPAYIITLTFLALASLLSGQFNRRGGWLRITLTVLFGASLLFTSPVIRNVALQTPSLFMLPYLWWFIPTLCAVFVLRRNDGLQKVAA